MDVSAHQAVATVTEPSPITSSAEDFVAISYWSAVRMADPRPFSTMASRQTWTTASSLPH